MLISLDFALRTYKRIKTLGDTALDQDPEIQAIRGSFMFKGFLVALALATVAIFIRSIFRVIELSKGWSGPIMGNQELFIGFEGVCVIVAALILNIFHPAICFKKMLEGAGGFSLWGRKRARRDKNILEGKNKDKTGSESKRQTDGT